MKYNKNRVIILMVLLSLFAINKGLSQNSIDPNLLTGTWMFDYDESKTKMDAKTKEHLQTMKPERKTKFEASYKNRKLTFNTDGTFMQQLANGKEVLGAWSLNNNKVVLTTTKGSSRALKIKTLTASLLILKYENKGKSKMMMSEWNFTKI